MVVREISTMTNIFGTEFKPTFVDPLPTRQGRSKKQLKPIIRCDGRAWVAYYEGRGNRFFGATQKEAHNNLQAGGGQ
jgi:hypothetical protein